MQANYSFYTSAPTSVFNLQVDNIIFILLFTNWNIIERTNRQKDTFVLIFIQDADNK